MTLATARLLALAAAVLFSTGGAGIKVEAFSGPQVAALRSGIAALALLIWLRGRARPSGPVLLLSLVYAAMITLFVNATKLTTSANAIFLQSAAPLYVVLLAPRILGEPFRARDLSYLAAAGMGMALCVLGQSDPTSLAPDPATGNLLAVLCGITWALTLLGLRLAERDHPAEGIGVAAVVWGNLGASLVSLPFAWPIPQASTGEWATLIYLGAVQIGLAYVCLASAMRTLPALDASLLLLLEPVLNPIWTWLVRGEEPGAWVLLGGGVILAATTAKALHDARAPAS